MRSSRSMIREDGSVDYGAAYDWFSDGPKEKPEEPKLSLPLARRLLTNTIGRFSVARERPSRNSEWRSR